MATEAKVGHTPGPWNVKLPDFDAMAEAYEDDPTCVSWRLCTAEISSSNWYGLAYVFVVSDGEMDDGGIANARLVAAAPDFYEQARAMIERHDEKARACNFRACGCDDCTPFRAVLAKVEGGAS